MLQTSELNCLHIMHNFIETHCEVWPHGLDLPFQITLQICLLLNTIPSTDMSVLVCTGSIPIVLNITCTLVFNFVALAY
jgi:hypothetical protein